MSQDIIVEELARQTRRVAPGLSQADVADLLVLPPDHLVKVLSDYKRAKKLNKSQVSAIIKVIMEVKSILEPFLVALAALL